MVDQEEEGSATSPEEPASSTDISSSERGAPPEEERDKGDSGIEKPTAPQTVEEDASEAVEHNGNHEQEEPGKGDPKRSKHRKSGATSSNRRTTKTTKTRKSREKERTGSPRRQRNAHARARSVSVRRNSNASRDRSVSVRRTPRRTTSRSVSPSRLTLRRTASRSVSPSRSSRRSGSPSRRLAEEAAQAAEMVPEQQQTQVPSSSKMERSSRRDHSPTRPSRRSRNKEGTTTTTAPGNSVSPRQKHRFRRMATDTEIGSKSKPIRRTTSDVNHQVEPEVSWRRESAHDKDRKKELSPTRPKRRTTTVAHRKEPSPRQANRFRRTTTDTHLVLRKSPSDALDGSSGRMGDSSRLDASSNRLATDRNSTSRTSSRRPTTTTTRRSRNKPSDRKKRRSHDNDLSRSSIRSSQDRLGASLSSLAQPYHHGSRISRNSRRSRVDMVGTQQLAASCSVLEFEPDEDGDEDQDMEEEEDIPELEASQKTATELLRGFDHSRMDASQKEKKKGVLSALKKAGKPISTLKKAGNKIMETIQKGDKKGKGDGDEENAPNKSAAELDASFVNKEQSDRTAITTLTTEPAIIPENPDAMVMETDKDVDLRRRRRRDTAAAAAARAREMDLAEDEEREQRRRRRRERARATAQVAAAHAHARNEAKKSRRGAEEEQEDQGRRKRTEAATAAASAARQARSRREGRLAPTASANTRRTDSQAAAAEAAARARIRARKKGIAIDGNSSFDNTDGGDEEIVMARRRHEGAMLAAVRTAKARSEGRAAMRTISNDAAKAASNRKLQRTTINAGEGTGHHDSQPCRRSD